METTDLCFTPATELAAMIRSRTLSPVEIMDAVLARIEALNLASQCLSDGRRRARQRAGEGG